MRLHLPITLLAAVLACYTSVSWPSQHLNPRMGSELHL